MGRHPLIELASSREVKQAAAFREAAAGLTGESLRPLYEQEQAGAPRRHDAEKKYFVGHNTKLASSRRPDRDREHVAIALVAHHRATAARLTLPGAPEGGAEEHSLEFIHPLVPLKSAQPDKAQGADDPNYGVGSIDLLAIGPGARLGVVGVRYLAPDAGRVGVGDTPLRALLEGLANCAIASVNREALASEIAAAGGRQVADEPPVLVLLGSKRYWELCRKREAQKGAAWIRELERLAKEIESEIGVTVIFQTLRLDGNPGWSYPEGSPVLDSAPALDKAWESTAGRLRPKPRPRPRSTDPADLVVEADLSRPVRRYAVTDNFSAGDRIDHPTLGLGVVQGDVGPGKIRVLFDGKKSLLVHDRPPARGSAPSLGSPG